MTTQLALTPAASAAAASTAIRVEVRNLTVTGPDIQTLLEAVEVDMAIAPTMEIDSDDMAGELIDMLGRLSTVSCAIEAERKERTAPLLDAQKWLMAGYSPARAMLDGLIEAGKGKLSTYNRAKMEAKRKADADAAEQRRKDAAAAAAIEAAAIVAAQEVIAAAAALHDAGSEQVAQAMTNDAMVAVDTARASAASAVRAMYTAPVHSTVTPIKGASQTWSAEVTSKVALVAHVAQMIASGDLSLLGLLDVNQPAINAMAKLQKENMSLPGVRPVCSDKVAIRKQAVSA